MKKDKGIAALIIEAMPKKGSESKADPLEGSEDESESVGLEAASDEVFDALKNDDRKGFKSALMNFIELCGESYEDDESEEEPEEE